MGKTVNLQQLTALANVATEYSTLSDDYLFAHIQRTEGDVERSWHSRVPGPLRIDGMALLLCLEGRMELDINMTPCTLTPDCITVIPPGSIIDTREVAPGAWDCYALFVSADFMRDINFDPNVLARIQHRDGLTGTIHHIDHEGLDNIRRYFDLLHLNSNPGHNPAYTKPIARCLIAALMYNIIEVVMRISGDAENEPVHTSRRLTYVHSFMSLVHRHHRQERSVAFYAEKLCISPKYLSLIIKEHTGRSAAQIIDNLVILEAKNLLRYSGKNVQQVAYELNFPNQSSFGKYFKHLTGMSPSEYQRS
ncbi:MAG: helix-turn-helix domain-containing protein [Duncaniella sp.]|nr:helix-turn-helix domain-containing protein [Duncaniella sp.]